MAILDKPQWISLKGTARKDLIETSILGHLFPYYSLVNFCKWWRNPQKFYPSKNHLYKVLDQTQCSQYYCTRRFIGESNIWCIVCEKRLAFYIGNLSYHIFLLEFLRLQLRLYSHVHIVINIGNFKICQLPILILRQ